MGFYKYIGYPTQVPEELAELGYYIPKLFAKNGGGTRTEYVQLYLGYYEPFISIKRDLRGWLRVNNYKIYRNILKVEKR